MPAAGDRYLMPEGLGEYLVVRSHAETGGEYVEMEWFLPAGAFAPPPHRHPTQVEVYEILEGRLEVMVDGAWKPLATGDRATVPVNANHTFRLPSGESARVRNFHRPGSHFDTFIEEQHRFVTSSGFKGLKRPSTALMMSKVWSEARGSARADQSGVALDDGGPCALGARAATDPRGCGRR
jgi:mannose-6-phosphate isomerase-like protein (cupin superfamily)